MSKSLPLEIMGLLSPLLCWVETTKRMGLPLAWTGKGRSFKDREKAWLVQELPTYSFDNLDEIIAAARDPSLKGNLPQWRTGREMDSGNSLDPPADFNLVRVFRKLAEHYFQWIGSELCIREGLMVEFHELAVRFPVRHLIQFTHAEAAVYGYLSPERAAGLAGLPEQAPPTSQGLRTVVDRGISEGHLHLNGILSGDESWANQVLSNNDSEEDREPSRRRLIVLGRATVRLLALGACYALLGELAPREVERSPQRCRRKETRKGRRCLSSRDCSYDCGWRSVKRPQEPPLDLCDTLDALYWADENNEFQRRRQLESKLAKAAADLQELVTKPLLERHWNELSWLLCIVKPEMARFLPGRESGLRPLPSGIRGNLESLKKLHFKIQYLLAQRGPADRDGASMGGRGRWKWKNPLWIFLHGTFYRYLVFNSHHWQQCTQSGKTTGLRYFVRFYGSKFRRGVTDPLEAGSMAFDRMVLDPSLQAVEGRLSPEGNMDKYLPWILSFLENRDRKRVDRFGFVIHFIKGDTSVKGKSHRARFGIPRLRSGSVRRETRRRALLLFRLMSRPNPALPFIVGIDAANLELNTPPEVFAPAFRFLRNDPIEIRQPNTALQQFGKHSEMFKELHGRRLAMTYHVGEDFRHLLSGLRAIHEVIKFLKPLPGDRLGHGTALALAPETWAEQNGWQAVLPKQEWLDTLVWLHHLLGPGHDLVGELSTEDHIQKLSRDIYSPNHNPYEGRQRLDVHSGAGRDPAEESETCESMDWSIPALYDAWRLRQLDPYLVDVAALAKGRFKFVSRGNKSLEEQRWATIQEKVFEEVDQFVGSNAAWRLLGLYWFNDGVRTRGEEIITINMLQNKRQWLQVCHEAQDKVRNLVSRKELVVEVNPSSNRIIGPMASMEDHHAFALTLDERKRLKRDIRVTINTDNPGVLATSLAHEYYMLGETLLGWGVPEAEVEKWLEWLRKNGNDFSFLRHAPDPDLPLVEEYYKELVRRNEPMLRRMKGQRRRQPRVIAEDQKTRSEAMESKLNKQKDWPPQWG